MRSNVLKDQTTGNTIYMIRNADIIEMEWRPVLVFGSSTFGLRCPSDKPAAAITSLSALLDLRRFHYH